MPWAVRHHGQNSRTKTPWAKTNQSVEPPMIPISGASSRTPLGVTEIISPRYTNIPGTVTGMPKIRDQRELSTFSHPLPLQPAMPNDASDRSWISSNWLIAKPATARMRRAKSENQVSGVSRFSLMAEWLSGG